MKLIKIFILPAVFVFLTVANSCSSKKTEDTANTEESVRSIPVKTMLVKQEEINLSIDYTATLVAFEEVHLAPATPGRIEKINVEIGNTVNKGDVVAVMDRTNLEQARINLMNIETNFKRLDTLKKTNSIADQQYDQVKSSYDLAKNSYSYLLENTQLKAPFSGVISGKYFEDGEIYSGAPVATVGKPAIVSIVQINQLKALIGISSSYFPIVKTGMRADVKSDIYPDMPFRGEIFRIYPVVDNATKTFTIEIRIQNTDLKLRPGMFSKITLNMGKGSAIMVPTIALIKQTGTNNMYVYLNRGNKAFKQSVKIGRIVDDKTEILEGIIQGDEVVIVGQNKLEAEMPLNVIK